MFLCSGKNSEYFFKKISIIGSFCERQTWIGYIMFILMYQMNIWFKRIARLSALSSFWFFVIVLLTVNFHADSIWFWSCTFRFEIQMKQASALLHCVSFFLVNRYVLHKWLICLACTIIWNNKHISSKPSDSSEFSKQTKKNRQNSMKIECL